MKSLASYDVVVFGGGPAGFPAAIQAARLGARVLLVEKSGQLGGTTTLNRVAFPGLFHAWGRQIISGIGWDLARRTVELEGGTLPDFSNTNLRHFQHQIPLCPALFSALIDEDLAQSGADILFHVMPAAICRDATGIWTLQLCGKEGLFQIKTRWIIDATGDANAAALAGCPLRSKSDQLQPGTLCFCLDGYEVDHLNIPSLDQLLPGAIERGELKKSDLGWTGQSLGHLLQGRGKNCVHITDIDATGSRGKTLAEIEGRAALLRVFRFLKGLPGLENLSIAWHAPECGIRETRGIIGRSTITLDDYVQGKFWDDAVSYSFYPIDLHTNEGLKGAPIRTGTLPTIPLSAMIPQASSCFLAAGRCISGDRLAHSAFRVQASCMAMGQAAGAVAALACKHRLNDAARVDRGELRAALERNGAIFPVAPTPTGLGESGKPPQPHPTARPQFVLN